MAVFSRVLVCLLMVMVTPCLAHKMDSFYLHFEYDEEKWTAEMRFDAGFMTPELRAVPQAPPPTIAWMEKRSEEQLEYMRREMLEFVFQQFEFFQGEEKIVWTIEIPGFEDPPYEYEYGEDNGVFFFLNLSAPFEGAKPLRMRVSEDCDLKVAVGIPTGREGDDDRNIYIIEAGKEQALIKPGEKIQPIPVGSQQLNQEVDGDDSLIPTDDEMVGLDTDNASLLPEKMLDDESDSHKVMSSWVWVGLGVLLSMVMLSGAARQKKGG